MTLNKPDNYKELFCLVVFGPTSTLVEACNEIRNPEMAEVSVPYELDGTLYSITCYIAHLKNWEPAIREVMYIQKHIEFVYSACVMKEPVLNEEQKFEMIENMRTYGGDFVKALAECFAHADSVNTLKLLVMFPEYAEKYSNMKKEDPDA